MTGVLQEIKNKLKCQGDIVNERMTSSITAHERLEGAIQNIVDDLPEDIVAKHAPYGTDMVAKSRALTDYIYQVASSSAVTMREELDTELQHALMQNSQYANFLELAVTANEDLRFADEGYANLSENVMAEIDSYDSQEVMEAAGDDGYSAKASVHHTALSTLTGHPSWPVSKK